LFTLLWNGDVMVMVSDMSVAGSTHVHVTGSDG